MWVLTTKRKKLFFCSDRKHSTVSLEEAAKYVSDIDARNDIVKYELSELFVPYREEDCIKKK